VLSWHWHPRPRSPDYAAGLPTHTQWSGKTIALGTFPHHEAEEKCARAKALTRAWRSTMRPKPSREWVMLELERLGVRVVSGRIGRQGAEPDDDAAGGNGGGNVGGASAAGGGDAGGGGMAGNMMGVSGLFGEQPEEYSILT